MSLIEQFKQSSQIGTGNSAYVDELYESWLTDSNSVEPSWHAYFESLKGRAAGDTAHGPIVASFAALAKTNRRPSLVSDNGAANAASQKQAAVLKLVNAYRTRGHLSADLDPLGMMQKQAAPDLELSFHGLDAIDNETEFSTGSISAAKKLKLKDLVASLKRTYSGTIGVEFMHISDTEQRQWIHARLEQASGHYALDPETRIRILNRLTAAEGLERYLHNKYVGQKRFSLEGGDSLIPLMDGLIRRAAGVGVKEIVLGMAHRGRLNVLINTLGKAPGKLFAEFEGKFEHSTDPAHSGDVKYHMGFSSDVTTPHGPVHLALGFNPSHLEIIDPVVAGSVRARQARRQDTKREFVVPILIHGDAAFAGQGVIMELFQMSQARGFAVGGTIHVVVNNQVGFTTSRPEDARSTLYCTDPAKIVGAPVLHVNGDDPDAVLFAAHLAFDFRQQFKRDVVIDLVCYRRHGHNEADEPAATQPMMYQNIRARKTTRDLYANKLADAGVITATLATTMAEDYRAKLVSGETVAELAGENPNVQTWHWSKHLGAKLDEEVTTSIGLTRLVSMAKKITAVPTNFVLHSRVAKVIEDRVKMAAGELRMDWGFAENMAYASLLDEGFKLRLVGQDAGRGTFFHRHAVLHDQQTGAAHLTLSAVNNQTNAAMVIDSLLSEEAVMAFEYGYATTDPSTLTIWEGQFGDFANGAQVVIDQFISSGEAKWDRLCALALFLPHGYEGQGPEHSSARLERFLQLCAMNNMQVCVPTTPAQMFHMIRRQMLRNVRKPLIVMTPKSMLRHKLSTSSIEDLTKGAFQNLIPDTQVVDAKTARRVVICAGKVYYDLIEDADKRGVKDVAILRAEQLYPFPRALLSVELQKYAQVKDVVWCQEEPMNQGAWYQIQHHLRACLGEKQKLHYAGRVRSPAPACGHFPEHVEEQNALLEQALVAKLNGDQVAE